MASNPDKKLEEQLQLARELQAGYQSNVPSGREWSTRVNRNPSYRGRTSVRGSTRGSRSVAPVVTVVDVVPDMSTTDRSTSADQVSSTAADQVSSAAADQVFSTGGNSQSNIFPPGSRQELMRSYPAGYGLASSYWAPPGEDYCAPFTQPRLMNWKGPSQAFLDGADLIDLFSPNPPIPAANKPSPVKEQTAVTPSVRTANNENRSLANASKPAKGLGSSKWAQ